LAGLSAFVGGGAVTRGCFVGVGVGKYDHFGPLDYAVRDLCLVRSVLDADLVGQPLANPYEGETRDRLTELAEALPDGGVLVALWSGHGRGSPNGGLRFYASNSTATDFGGFSAGDVAAACAASGASQVLLIFDTCFSGAAVPTALGVAHAVLEATPPRQEQVWVGVLASCRAAETAVDGVFGERLVALLRDGPADPDLRRRAWSVHDQYIKGHDLCDALVDGWGDDLQRPDYQGRGKSWWMFRNPRYDSGAPAQVVEHLLLAARGGSPPSGPSWFSGRAGEVERVVAWIRSDEPGIRVVTGAAGTGKSAIAGRVVSLSNPRERQRILRESSLEHADPGEGSVAAHVHARALTADQVAEELDGGLVAAGWLLAEETGRRNAAELIGRVQRIAEAGAPLPVLVVDGLDEARGDAFPIADDLLIRLARFAILVVTTRNLPDPANADRTLVDTLRPAEVLDLDSPNSRASGAIALRKYVTRRLAGVSDQMDPRAIADLLAATTRHDATGPSR
jgi:hypothetical protein